MKTNLPYRYQEILTVLTRQPSMTTNEIYQECRDEPGSELPDSTITGQCLYAMEKTDYVTTDRDGDGPNRHKITDKGREVLAAVLGHEIESDKTDDLLKSFDAAVAAIRSVLEDNLAAHPKPPIENRRKKIEILELLENSIFLKSDVAATLKAIREDLEQC